MMKSFGGFVDSGGSTYRDLDEAVEAVLVLALVLALDVELPAALPLDLVDLVDLVDLMDLVDLVVLAIVSDSETAMARK